MSKPKIAIFIDYSIRIPAFKNSYTNFKTWLYQDVSNVSFEDKIEGPEDPRIYWARELQDSDKMSFYLGKNADKVKETDLKGDFSSFFFNEEHLNKFLEEYTFNLYSDCEVCSKRDVEIMNICQTKLFDITLVDVINQPRKVSNTLHFLSKVRIYFKELLFVGSSKELKEEDYLGVWNPVDNKAQENKEKSDIFLNWLKELENKTKNNG